MERSIYEAFRLSISHCDKNRGVTVLLGPDAILFGQLRTGNVVNRMLN